MIIQVRLKDKDQQCHHTADVPIIGEFHKSFIDGKFKEEMSEKRSNGRMIENIPPMLRLFHCGGVSNEKTKMYQMISEIGTDKQPKEYLEKDIYTNCELQFIIRDLMDILNEIERMKDRGVNVENVRINEYTLHLVRASGSPFPKIVLSPFAFIYSYVTFDSNDSNIFLAS